jgi:hypothetical protein
MESSPPKVIEFAVGLLLPPACRENVLGDLHERYTSPAQYIGEAFSTVPWVIVSRIVRTTDAGLFLLQAFALYLAFVTSARFAAGPDFLDLPNTYLRLAVPALIALVVLVFADAYARTERRLFQGSVAAFIALWLRFWSTATNSNLSVPFHVILYSSVLGILLVTVIRAIFLPGDHRTTGAG